MDFAGLGVFIGLKTPLIDEIGFETGFMVRFFNNCNGLLVETGFCVVFFLL